MTRMDLDQIGSDVHKRWSPTTLSRDARNRPHRSSHGSVHDPEIWETSSMRRERSNDRDFIVEEYRRDNTHRYPKKYELEEGEVLSETKGGRYSTDKLEARDYSRKRHKQRDETDSSDEENHERFNSNRSSHSRDFSKERYGSRDGKDLTASFGSREPRRYIKGYNSSPQRTRYARTGRRSLDCKHVHDVERDDEFSENGRLINRGTIQEARKSSRETINDLSWNGPKWGEKATTMDAPNSSSWKSENAGWPKWEENTTKDAPNFSKSENARENVSWPKWVDQATEYVPNSSIWRSGENNHACDKEAGNSFPSSVPKLGEETNTEGVGNSSLPNSIADNQGGSRTEKNVFCIVPKCGKEGNIKGAPSSPKQRLNAAKWGSSLKTEYAKDAPSSWRSSTTKQGPKEANDWPKWGENTTTKDAPNSSQWRSDNANWPKWGAETTSEDAPKSSKCWPDNVNQDCNEEVSNSFPLGGPKWGVETDTNVTTNSSQRKSLDNNRGSSNWETDKNKSCIVPKWGEETDTKEAPSSWKSFTANCGSKESNSPKWGNYANSKNVAISPQQILSADKWGSSMTADTRGATWGDEKNAKDAPSSWRSSTKWGSKETNNSSPWNVPNRGDEAPSKDASKPPMWGSADDKWGSNVKTGNDSSWPGPKWRDEKNAKDAPLSSRSSAKSGCKETTNSSSCSKWGSKETNNSSPRNGSNWSNEAPAKDASKPPRWGSADDKWGSNVKTDNDSSWPGPKWRDETHAKDAPLSSRSSAKSGCKETTNSSSWSDSKWDNKITAKDPPSFSGWKSDADKWCSNPKTDNDSSWPCPKWHDEKNAKDAPLSSRSSAKSGCKETTNSSSCSKWGLKETNNNSPWNGPNWGDEKPAKDASKPLRRGSADDKWGSNVKTDNDSSWPGPKWHDETNAKDAPLSSRSSAKSGCKETTNNSSWSDSKWDDKVTAKDRPSFSGWKSDADKWGSNVKSDNNSSWSGPKWGDRTSSDKQASSVEPRKSSWNDQKWGDDKTTKDASMSSRWRSDSYSKRGDQAIKKDFCSSQHRSDRDRKEYDVRPNNSSKQNEQTDISARSSHWWSDNARQGNVSSWNGAKWGDHSTTKGTENSSLPKVPKWGDNTSNHKGPVEEAKNGMSWNGPKWGDQAATNEPKPSWLRSDDGNMDDYLNRSKLNDRSTIEVSPNFSRQVLYNRIEDGVKTDSLLQNSSNLSDRKVTIDAPKPTHSEQNITIIPSGKDQHSVKISKSPSSNLNLSKQTGQDNRSLKNVAQNHLPPLHEAQSQHKKHPISENGQDAMPKPPPNRQSLKSDWHNHQVGNGAAAAMGTAPIATELITSGSSFQNLIIIKESESATSDHGKLEPQQVVLTGDTSMDSTKAETGQSKKENAAADDEMGIQMFKFALVEFVKNLLKRSWKEGRISIEDHRTIVKKVVDKVFGTLPSPNIPRTPENIEHYMSYFKTKLTDLVQAYIELYGKRPAQV